MQAIDSHCHLADSAFVPDLAGVVERAQTAGLVRALCILSADEPDELARARVVATAWPAVAFSAGIHPHRAGPYAGRTADAVKLTEEAIRAHDGVAVGEIGLDYHYDFAPRETQREVFAAQVDLAKRLDRPIIIHTREAWTDTMAILREQGSGALQGVMHCFSGTLAEARQALDLGFLISVAGILTFPKAASLRDVVKYVPVDRLLVETDAPFLAPVPHRGKRNEPAWVVETIGTLASLVSMPVSAVSEQLVRNFSTFARRVT